MFNIKEKGYKFIRVGFTNCYLLECNNGYLLIDVGYTGAYQKFVKKLKKKYDINISEIKYLLLTHHHDDHSGFANELRRNTGAKLIINEQSLEGLKIGKPDEESKPINRRIKFIVGIFSLFHKFIFPPIIPTENDIILTDSGLMTEVLREIGINGIILYTPGHSQDGISVILQDGSVFPGDNTMNAWYFNIFGIKKRPIYVQDINLIFKSWEKYIKLGGIIIYPSHGKAFNISKLKTNLAQYQNK